MMLTVLNIFEVAVLVPLLKYTDGKDYGLVVRIVFGVTGLALFILSIIQRKKMKQQISALTDNEFDKLSDELENAYVFRKIFYLTDSYVFSTEGMILPYWQIEKVVTQSYGTTSGTATSIYFHTKDYGICYIPVGWGTMNTDFYEMLSAKCSCADIDFRINYQKATMKEYYATIKAESVLVIKEDKLR